MINPAQWLRQTGAAAVPVAACEAGARIAPCELRWFRNDLSPEGFPSIAGMLYSGN
jgi:hypothetical protein